VLLLLVGLHEVLREQVENAATTIRNNRGRYVGKSESGRIISPAPSLL
jgi:hypothetical protein